MRETAVLLLLDVRVEPSGEPSTCVNRAATPNMRSVPR